MQKSVNFNKVNMWIISLNDLDPKKWMYYMPMNTFCI